MEATQTPHAGPGRPALYPDQGGLLVLTLVALGAGIYAALRFLL